jgi:hypothetical protein
MKPLVLTVFVFAALAGCSREQPAAEPAAPPPPSWRHWIGQWAGPEGTSLTVAHVGEVYTISIRDLDRSTTYQAHAVAEGLRFERRGQEETLRATDGAGTGMKWLAERQDCLTVRSGEGFCRD